MKVRWFGEPWPSTRARAPVCADDALQVEPPIGERCLGCGSVIEVDDRGVLVLANMDVDGAFLWVIEEAVVSVGAYHIDCIIDAVVPNVDGIERKPL